MIRRALILSATALLPIGLGLAACAGQTPQQVAVDIANLAAAARADLPLLGAALGISPSVVASVGVYVGDLQAVASALSGGTLPAGNAVQQAYGYLQDIVHVAALLPAGTLPAAWVQFLAAGVALFPALAALAGVSLPAGAAPASARFAATLPAMSAAQARMVLAAQAVRG